MNGPLNFLGLTDINFLYVIIGVTIICGCTSAVGCFTFLRKRALIGDAVAHAVLPGICLAFILFENKNPVVLLSGAFVTGWLSLVAVDYITNNTKLKSDTAIGVVLSVFFGVGILLLTSIQKSGLAAQSGLDKFLFGNAASMLRGDVIILAATAAIIFPILILFYKEFKLIAFDRNFAEAAGLPVKLIEFMLTGITVLAVVIGIQAVGVVLTGAMLVTPAAAARYRTDKLQSMIIFAVLFGTAAGIFGVLISSSALHTPTGPWIVMFISVTAVTAFIFSPRKGILARYRQHRRNKAQILEENILKTLYKIGENRNDFSKSSQFNEILEVRFITPKLLRKGLKKLKRSGFSAERNEEWALTEKGKEKGQRITRLHRLWELYLTEYLRIAPDHVHEDAESIEHVITPEIEAKLDKLLQYPVKDPHDSGIPQPRKRKI